MTNILMGRSHHGLRPALKNKNNFISKRPKTILKCDLILLFKRIKLVGLGSWLNGKEGGASSGPSTQGGTRSHL